MLIMAIDPGVMTGVYYVIDDISYYDSILFDDYLLLHLSKYLSKLDMIDKIVIVEQPPRNGDPEQTKKVNAIETAIIDIPKLEIVRILPGEWKPLAKAQKWTQDIPTTISVHVKDAYCMYRYYKMVKETIK